MRRLAGAVIALDQGAAVVREAGEDRERRVAVEAVGGVELGHVLVGAAERRHFPIGVDAEGLAHRDLDIRQGLRRAGGGSRRLNHRSGSGQKSLAEAENGVLGCQEAARFFKIA